MGPGSLDSRSGCRAGRWQTPIPTRPRRPGQGHRVLVSALPGCGWHHAGPLPPHVPTQEDPPGRKSLRACPPRPRAALAQGQPCPGIRESRLAVSLGSSQWWSLSQSGGGRGHAKHPGQEVLTCLCSSRACSPSAQVSKPPGLQGLHPGLVLAGQSLGPPLPRTPGNRKPRQAGSPAAILCPHREKVEAGRAQPALAPHLWTGEWGPRHPGTLVCTRPS